MVFKTVGFISLYHPRKIISYIECESHRLFESTVQLILVDKKAFGDV